MSVTVLAMPPSMPRSMTLRQLMERSIAMIWAGKASEVTVQSYWLEIIDVLGPDFPVADIDTETIDRLVVHWRKKGNCGGTINKKQCALNVALKFAEARGYIEKLPKFTHFKPNQERLRWLTDEEEKWLLTYFLDMGWEEMHDFVILALDTGMRRSELLRLKWNHYDEHGFLHLWRTKNSISRSLPTTDRAKEALLRRKLDRARDGKIFGMLKTAVRYKWDEGRKALRLSGDKEFVLHACRHTFATRLVRENVHIKVIQELMGHKTLEQTAKYAKIHGSLYLDAINRLNRRNNLKKG
ncbi:tyrosine-type recombinase/integrase [Aestuariispira insulae]|uniref:Site-specific recombinase XerD n=1 Tax=Aestuariispira insulae TaxID=1461337 RepID=A0A3D9HVG8_9PROT|nr:site-specific integrase [Aestuariispira insulae]RED53488.1 site-specific recombinase XerD [Aestuariispira insulae]